MEVVKPYSLRVKQRPAMQQEGVDTVAEGAVIRNDTTDHQLESEVTSAEPSRELSQGNCCKGLSSRFKLNKETTRPNYKNLTLMFVALISSSFTLTFLFPFLPDMVKWLGYSEEAKGYYVGLIASSVFAGRACGSFFWGWLSDVKGRKVVLLLTIAGNGIFSLLFGFSVNLPMAMFLRFMSGLCNGTVGTAKTVLYEVSDNTNQAIGMSAIALAWGTGLILGPTCGGYLASPAMKYPSVFDPEGFFSQYPFCLPSVAVLVICAIGFFVVLFKFEETLQIKKDVVEISDPEEDADEVKPLTDKVSVSASHNNIYRSRDSLHFGPLSAMSIEDIHCVSETEPSLVSLLCVSDIRDSILLYTVFSFGVIGVEDVFTIFLSTEPHYNGMGFTSNEIGLALGVVSVPILVVQLLVYPAMVLKFGIKKTFLIGGMVLVVTVQTLPMLHRLHDNKVLLWTLLMLITLPERLAVNCCFSGSSLMINNSANPLNAGTVNGIAMTFTAIARTLAPTVGGSVYAWSISYGAEYLGPPFDHNLVFLIFGLVFAISIIQCLVLPESLNKQTKKS
ncbi:protein ZINC INDUCED FACILITATOR-LIKE 1-like [Haliotis rubra]|uniref:protein ZINC INDUCED FACILITATOR-LIKE 1-like n=1 Tax=Haliotis rubra TaxID=36100 RepID=UPI001EE5D47E|nr:protein ZINC INDUCED FACILITATOR-LIKE 1-like [Haliotis rubra]